MKWHGPTACCVPAFGTENPGQFYSDPDLTQLNSSSSYSEAAFFKKRVRSFAHQPLIKEWSAISRSFIRLYASAQKYQRRGHLNPFLGSLSRKFGCITSEPFSNFLQLVSYRAWDVEGGRQLAEYR